MEKYNSAVVRKSAVRKSAVVRKSLITKTRYPTNFSGFYVNGKSYYKLTGIAIHY